jgi:K+-sensing histidine kinase KdpD
MTQESGPTRRLVRVVSAAIGVAVIWLTILAFTTVSPPDLTVALLVVLAEVLVLAVLAGPVLSVLAALAAVVLVNWYLVPPYGTFVIASPDNVAALLVFALVAIVAATLMEVGVRARSRAADAARQTELLADIVTVTDSDDAQRALDRVRTGLGVDHIELRGPLDGRQDQVLVSSGVASDGAVLDVPLMDGFRLVGRGNEILAPDPDFLVSLGSAAVRAYEGDQLQAETDRAEELAAIDRARTALLASVGHDLRTPIASLRVSVDALRATDGTLSDADRGALLQTIDASTDRLDDLITNLLDMSRLQAGAFLAQCAPSDVGDVVDRAELAFATERLVIDIPHGLPRVVVDPTLLERVIANLVSNALRYSPPDAAVEVTACAVGDTVELAVADRGPGIAASDAAAVFTPFHRIGAQPDGGSGLGLAIVKAFTEAMDVELALVPRDGGGLVARVVMPVWKGVA